MLIIFECNENMKCDSKLEASIDEFIAEVEYGNSTSGLQCWYCNMLPGNLNRERNIRSRAFYDITHCALWLQFKKKMKGVLFLAHFHLLFETDTPTSIEFLPIFLWFNASIVTISNLDSWRPQNPQTQNKNCYALCCLWHINCAVYS